MKMEQSVPKRRHIKFRRRGITQKKGYNNLQHDIFLEQTVVFLVASWAVNDLRTHSV
jgi:hypothetical protein